MAQQQKKWSKGNGGMRNSGVRMRSIFRTEWRIVSDFRPIRKEVFDISFEDGESVHRNLTEKLLHAERMLKEHQMRYGETMALSKVYFIGKG